MAMDLNAFMRENIKDAGTVKFAASQRIIDPKTKKPMLWEIKPLSNKVDAQLRRECTVVTKGKRGRRDVELDTDLYALKMCVACTVFPPLNDASLQDNHGVMGADDLLMDLLTPGELNEYKSKVMEVNGYDMTMDELVDEAKN